MAPSVGLGGDESGIQAPFVIGIITGTVVFVGATLLTAYLYLKRRTNKKLSHDRQLKQFLLPKNVKPVISFKTAAGPGGLKKSPSPVQSPDYPESKELISRSMDSSMESNDSMVRSSSRYEPMAADDTQIIMDEISGGPEITVKGEGIPPGQEAMLVSTDESNNKVPKDTEGFLNFTLRYNFDKNALMVTIVSAQELPEPISALAGGGGSEGVHSGMNDGGISQTLDPYIKLQLLPEKQHKVKTRVVRNTLNPVYDEEFTFYGINYNQLQSTTLHFAIISFDRYSRDEIIGEVLCPLYNVDLSDSDKEASIASPIMTRNLKFQNSTVRGELLFSLCYQSATNRLTVVAMKARNLPKFDVTGLADPYVKIYLLYDGQRIAKKKSHVKKRTLAPVYNESFTFDLPTNDPAGLDKVSLEFFVMDWDRLTKNEVMGCVEIGANVRTPLGRSHWKQTVQNPRKSVAEWHKLRP